MRSRSLLAVAMLAVAGGGSAAYAVSDVYAIDLRANPNRLLRFPVNAPANTALSTNASFDGFAMDFSADASTLYGITNPGNAFGTIDQTTGNFTSIATISGDGAAETNWSGLASAPDGTFYASAAGGAGVNRLYTLNPVTGATTLVGAIGAGTAAINIDISIDRTGQMYGHDIGTDRFFQIDKTNGNVTFLGSGTSGFNANFAQGMDFDWDTNTLYATLYIGAGSGHFVSVNTTTGAATSITPTLSWNAEMEMAVKAAIPEPVSLSALAVTGLALGRRGRRN